MFGRARSISWILLLLPLFLFLIPARLPILVWKKADYSLPSPIAYDCDPLTLLPLPKKGAPAAFSDIVEHPWIQKQTALQMIVPEMVRDVEAIANFCAYYPECDSNELTDRLIKTLEPLQANIPLQLPSELYNVLWISEKPSQCPFPFRVVKRLYLGESYCGLPIYLDVRCFDASDEQGAVAWHEAQVAAEFTPCGRGEVALGEAKMPGHGWQLGKRAIYLQWAQKGGKFYLAYANLAAEDWERVAICLR